MEVPPQRRCNLQVRVHAAAEAGAQRGGDSRGYRWLEMLSVLRLIRDAWFAEREGHYAEMVPEIWPMGRCRAVGVVERWRGLPNGVGRGRGRGRGNGSVSVVGDG